jgi:hypothetical protein
MICCGIFSNLISEFFRNLLFHWFSRINPSGKIGAGFNQYCRKGMEELGIINLETV